MLSILTSDTYLFIFSKLYTLLNLKEVYMLQSFQSQKLKNNFMHCFYREGNRKINKSLSRIKALNEMLWGKWDGDM